PPDGPASRPQTITFDQPSDTTVGRKVTLSASSVTTATPSFTSDTPGVCTVSGRTATAIKAGTCAIIARQAGNARRAPARAVRKSFPVARVSQTIAFRQPPDVASGRPVAVTPTAA